VPIGQPGTRLNVIAGMIVVFALVWLTWALISWAVIQVVRASALSGPDRLMGAVFGFVRGVVVALAVVTLVSMTPVAKWEPWKASRGVAWLQVLLKGLRPVLPEQVLQFLPEQP
jgi:membrane protein required for colicin V production